MPRPKAINHKEAISITLDKETLEAVKIIQESWGISSISTMINSMLKTQMLYFRARDEEGRLYEIKYDHYNKPKYKLQEITKAKNYKVIILGDSLHEAIKSIYENFQVLELPR